VVDSLVPALLHQVRKTSSRNDFLQSFFPPNMGLLMGDVSIRRGAPCLVEATDPCTEGIPSFVAVFAPAMLQQAKTALSAVILLNVFEKR
jgi:hypothetical protein